MLTAIIGKKNKVLRKNQLLEVDSVINNFEKIETILRDSISYSLKIFEHLKKNFDEYLKGKKNFSRKVNPSREKKIFKISRE